MKHSRPKYVLYFGRVTYFFLSCWCRVRCITAISSMIPGKFLRIIRSSGCTPMTRRRYFRTWKTVRTDNLDLEIRLSCSLMCCAYVMHSKDEHIIFWWSARLFSLFSNICQVLQMHLLTFLSRVALEHCVLTVPSHHLRSPIIILSGICLIKS